MGQHRHSWIYSDLAERTYTQVGTSPEGLPLFDLREVAAAMRVSWHTLDSWIRGGRVPQPYKAGRARGYALHQLQTIQSGGLKPARTFPRELTRARNTTGIGNAAVRQVSERTHRKHAAKKS